MISSSMYQMNKIYDGLMADHPEHMQHLYDSVEAAILYGTPLDQRATLLMGLLPGIIMLVIQRNRLKDNYAALFNIEFYLHEYMKSKIPPEKWSLEYYRRLVPNVWGRTILSWDPTLRENICKLFHPILGYNWYARLSDDRHEELIISNLQTFRTY